jgi:crotonobetainyl-CoA:carnitine CoA-transferase CaiB-like acyl-CoA transferase
LAHPKVDLVISCAGDDNWCRDVVRRRGLADPENFLCDSGADTRSAGRDGLEAALRARAADVAPQRVMFELQGAGLAAGAMLRPLDYRLDPQFLARRFAVELDQPGLSDPLLVENAPCLSQRMPAPELASAPYMFEHTRQVARRSCSPAAHRARWPSV